MSGSDQTTVIQGWIDRLRAGDDSARAALLDCACDRLRRLARKMLRRYPGVARWEQDDDVLQNALIRLDRALRAVAPPTARDFFRLATEQIRRELIDLARHYAGPESSAVHHASQHKIDGREDASTGPEEPAAQTTHDPTRLAAWTEFHRRVEELDEGDRELFDLLWYQGLTQAEAAALLGLSERTVARRWVAARMKLGDALGGQLPF